MSNLPEPNWSRLGVGEFERLFGDAAAQVAAHPERKALAGLYGALTLAVVVTTILAVVMVGWMVAR